MVTYNYSERVEQPVSDMTSAERDQIRADDLYQTTKQLCATVSTFEQLMRTIPEPDSRISDLTSQFGESVAYTSSLLHQLNDCLQGSSDSASDRNGRLEIDIDSGGDSDDSLQSPTDSESGGGSFQSPTDSESSDNDTDADSPLSSLEFSNNDISLGDYDNIIFCKDDDDNGSGDEDGNLSPGTLAKVIQVLQVLVGQINNHRWRLAPNSPVPYREPQGILLNIIVAAIFPSPDRFANHFSGKTSFIWLIYES